MDRTLRRVLDPAGGFEPLPAPDKDDWLANHPEPGQSFQSYVRSDPPRPRPGARTLFLLPLGELPPNVGPSEDLLRSFASAFFWLPVEVLPPIDLSRYSLTRRRNPLNGGEQMLTGDLLALCRDQLPEDGFALLGITMRDLYPDPTWNYVFGQASLRHRVGLYSFARYDPRFYGSTPRPGFEVQIVRRSLAVLAHETTHMLGIPHCIYYHCLMNGSNHLAEADARPLGLCPVDLRKLHYAVGIEPLERYRQLLSIYRSEGLEAEANWIRRRLEWIEGAQAGLGAA